MKDRLLFAAVCIVVVMMWSSTDVGAQVCGDDGPAPHATSEHVDFAGIVPGQSRSWSTTVTNAHDDPVEVSAIVEGTGALSSVLRVSLSACASPWQTAGPGPATCPSGASVVLAPTALDDEIAVELADLAPGGTWHARFSAQLPAATGNEYQGATASVRSLVIWQARCGPAPTTTTTTAPGPAPTAVPVTVAPTAPPTTARPTRPTPGRPRADGPRRGDDPARPDRLPFTGAPTTLTLVVAAGLVIAGLSALVAGSRRSDRIEGIDRTDGTES